MPSTPQRGRARVAAALVLALVPATTRAQAPAAPPAPPTPPELPAPAAGPAVVVTEGGAASLPAVEVRPLKRARHDWYLGFGIGLGAGNLRTTEANERAPAAVLLGQVRGGGRLRDDLLIGGLLSSAVSGSRRAEGVFSALVEVLGYPVRGRGLMLSAALGVGSYLVTDATSGESRASGQPGVAYAAGLSYEFWLARRFNLGLMLRLDGLGVPAVGGARMAGTFGLTFTWY